MKKTAFLLVLALLLQILLPPSMAGNVMAASAEKTVQTQAADWRSAEKVCMTRII